MRPYQSTRQWTHPEGYKYLAPWTNAVLLRFLIRKFTETLPRPEHRTKTQLDDAARSVVSNIEEGYKRPSTKEYLSFLGFSQGSLEEIKGLLKQVYQDRFLQSRPGSSLADLGIDLKEVKGLLKDSKGEIPLEVLYPPLASLNSPLASLNSPLTSLKSPLSSSKSPLTSSNDFAVTLEMFMELVNKTDYLLRTLVKSLENKMAEEMPMSPREKWLKVQAIKRLEEDRKFDEELRKRAGLDEKLKKEFRGK
ncbi:four helix bundle protein [Candidatus Parcubacteria bacterium]|nr:four helix bundle protein [Candidatus Parcubacteria bacterium]